MKKKFILLTLFLGLVFGNTQAQLVINSPNVGDLVGTTNGIIYHSGVATSHYNNTGNPLADSYVVSVWENTSGNTELDWTGILGTFPAGDLIIEDALDPDVEFWVDGTSVFVGYHNSSGVHLEHYEMQVPNGLVLMNSVIYPNTSGATNVNIDYSKIGWSSLGAGAITWELNSQVYAAIFDITMSSSLPTLVGDGEMPDITVHNFGKQCILSFILPNGNLEMQECNFDQLVLGNYVLDNNYTESWQNGSYSYPRVASVHVGFHEWTVTAQLNAPSNYNRVRAFTKNGSGYYNYEVSVGAGNTPCMFPVVTYNEGLVKFAFNTDYGWSGASTLWTFTNPGTYERDIFVVEAEIGNMNLSTLEFFELNSTQSGFHRGSPSISSVRWKYNQGYDINGFNYSSLTEIYTKELLSSANPKRLSMNKDESLILSLEEDIYIVSSDDLSNYKFELVNIEGRVIGYSSNMTMSDQELLIDTNGMTSGVYILHCISGNKIQNLKLVVH